MFIQPTKSVLATLLAILLSATALFAQADAHGDETASQSAPSLQDVQQEAKAFLQTLRAYSADQKDEAVESSGRALEELDQRIEKFEAWIAAQWDEMDQATRDEAQETLREMRRQRIELAEWYGSMKGSSADAWDHMKQGFSDAYGAMQKAWEKSVQEYQTEDAPEEATK
ncbi:MAG: hypothetical protein HWE39_16370 [Oceanospirillaceae bacterium]|nr:hypothetical protein [Oceanospirillaceae bacterium]